MKSSKTPGIKDFVNAAGKRSGKLALSALIIGVIASMGIHSPDELAAILGFTLPAAKLLWSFINLFGPDAFWKTVEGWGEKEPERDKLLDQLEALRLESQLENLQFRQGLARSFAHQQRLVESTFHGIQDQTAAALLAQLESYGLIHQEQIRNLESQLSEGVLSILEEIRSSYQSLKKDARELKDRGHQLGQDLSVIKGDLASLTDQMQGLEAPLPGQDLSHDPIFWVSNLEAPVSWLWGAPLIRKDLYVNRADLLQEITKMIFSAMEARTQEGGMLLTGMGGSGKSYTARSVWDQDEIKAMFPDGVLWASLGRQPNIPAVMRDWVSALGGRMRVPSPSLNQYRVALNVLLRDRGCLLIIDDVWEADHLEKFLVGGENSFLLATSRNRGIAKEMDIPAMAVPPMRKEEGLTLLDHWGGKNLSSSPSESGETILDLVGYLPKAIQLAGTHLQSVSAEEWIHNFSHIRDLDLEWRSLDPAKSLAAALQFSLEDLEPQKAHLFKALWVFPEDEAIPLEPIRRLWKELESDLTPIQIKNLLTELIDRALIEQIQAETMQVKLHDLVRDLVQENLDKDEASLHRTLLDAYSSTKNGAGWHTAPDDGYLHDHLTYHLREAGEQDDLRNLFRSDDWLRARVQGGDFLYEKYTEDLKLAWEVSHKELIDHIENGSNRKALGDCVHYALIHATVNSQLMNYDPHLIGWGVIKDAWTVEQAAALAEQRSDPEFRHKIYMYIFHKLEPEDPRWGRNLQRLIESAVNIDNDLVATRSSLFTDLMEFMTGEKAYSTIKTILDILPLEKRSDLLYTTIWLENHQFDTSLIAALVQRLQTAQISRLLERLLSVENASLLFLVLDRLSPPQISSVMDWIPSFVNEEEKIKLLYGIGEYLQPLDVYRYLEEVSMLSDEADQASVLTQVCERADGSQVQRILETALEFESDDNKAAVIKSLAEHLDELQTQIALEAVLPIRDQETKITALCHLVSQLWGTQKQEIIETILLAAPGILEGFSSVYDMAILVDELDRDQKPAYILSLLKSASSAEMDFVMTDLLTRLFYHLEGNTLDTAIQMAKDLDDPMYIWSAQAGLSELYSPDEQYLILKLTYKSVFRDWITFSSDFDQFTNEALNRIHYVLSAEQIPLAVDLILHMEDETHLAAAAISILPWLDEGQLDQVLEAALAMDDSLEKARILCGLMELADEELTARLTPTCLRIMESRRGDSRLAELLDKLVIFLSPKTALRAFDLAMQLDQDENQFRALVTLIPVLAGDQKELALKTALDIAHREKIHDNHLRKYIDLAPVADHQTLNQILEIGLDRTITWFYSPWEWDYYMNKVIPYLDKTQIQLLIDNAAEIDDRDEQDHFLKDYYQLKSDGRIEKRDQTNQKPFFWFENLLIQGKKLVIDAEELTKPQIDTILEAIDNLSDDLLTKNRAMIDLAGVVEGDMRNQVNDKALISLRDIATANALMYWDRPSLSDLMITIMPLLTERQQAEALQIAQQIVNRKLRAETLIAFVPYVDGPQKERLLESTLDACASFSDESIQAEILSSYLPLLKSDQQRQQLELYSEQFQHNEDPGERAFLLSKLLPFYDGSQAEDLAHRIFYAVLDMEDSDFDSRFDPTFLGFMDDLQIDLVVERIARIASDHLLSMEIDLIGERLSPEQLQLLWKRALDIEDNELRLLTLFSIVENARGEDARGYSQFLFAEYLRFFQEGEEISGFHRLAEILEEPDLLKILALAERVEDDSLKVHMLGSILPRLKGEEKQRALSLVLPAAVHDMDSLVYSDRLNWLFPQGLDSKDLRLDTRKLIAETLWMTQYFNRRMLLEILSETSYFNPDTFNVGEEEFAEIARSVLSICREWRWN